ncbi:hypothetical protein AVEN_122750-1 [Araneus ventricosus]|uniref:EGF-like domain-containing protein n=1 Tax=Araneus ventricosus TaxID=182803 RepID=A0A4Y2RUX8_ARAVE|nr:hypothetical protein AVEN_122750-1 [Araneus ventricosus]
MEKIPNRCDQECPGGSWGKDCENKCECSNNGYCSPFSGVCNCDPGFTGKYCELECMPGFFGKNCKNECQCNTGCLCHPVTGKCSCEFIQEKLNCSNEFKSELCNNQNCSCGTVSHNMTVEECPCNLKNETIKPELIFQAKRLLPSFLFIVIITTSLIAILSLTLPFVLQQRKKKLNANNQMNSALIFFLLEPPSTDYGPRCPSGKISASETKSSRFETRFH